MTRREFLARAAYAAGRQADFTATPEGIAADGAAAIALAEHFADLVDAHAAGLPYVDAVVIEGDTVVVATTGAYAADPVGLEARAGDPTSVLRGTDLVGAGLVNS